MANGDDQISTNAATGIRRFMDALHGTAPANQALPDGGEKLSKALDLPELAGVAGQVLLAENLHRSVFPLCDRARMQMGSGGTVIYNRVLEQAKEAIFQSVSSVQPPVRQLLETLNDPGIGQITMIESQIQQSWRPIPAAGLDQIAKTAEEARDAVNTLVDNGLIDGLLHQPLTDSLDWALRSVRVSKNLKVLVGLGPALTQVREEAVTVMTVVSSATADGLPQEHSEVWSKARLLLGVLAGFSLVLGTAGFVGATVIAVPQIAAGIADTFKFTGSDAAITERLQRFVEAIRPTKALPATKPKPELGSGNDD